MKRNRTVLVLVIIAAITGLYAPPAAAVPEYDILTEFFDSNLNELGWRFRGCDGTTGQGGQQSGWNVGDWKRIEYMECWGTTVLSVKWYYWDGSLWIHDPDFNPF